MLEKKTKQLQAFKVTLEYCINQIILKVKLSLMVISNVMVSVVCGFD